MKRAIIYRGPTTYAAAVNICIEVETDLLEIFGTYSMKTLDMSKVSISPSYSSTSGIPGVYGDVSGVSGGVPAMAVQNYQDQNGSHEERL
ncbi:hypothetical protein G6F15_013977 [Rhizopus arrhizus]|nr:hypothetical protein G6F15_013977 [Rhizopus arrhizus]KAG1142259.1 hypothetical protein G6F36_015584 [Rhizopus arrhizus]